MGLGLTGPWLAAWLKDPASTGSTGGRACGPTEKARVSMMRRVQWRGFSERQGLAAGDISHCRFCRYYPSLSARYSPENFTTSCFH